MTLTDFEQVLVGLLARAPRSGYQLKKFFATTPAVVYQPSSGALYPALRRLERRGLLSSEKSPSAGRRTQRSYRATSAGLAVHERWLRQPVEPATVGADLGIHLMRFVMAEHALSPDETLAYLSDLAAALEAFISDIERYLQDTPLPGRHPQLALLHGIEIHQASLRWAHSAIAALRAAQPSTGRNTS